VAVSIKEPLKTRPPSALWGPAEGDKVARDFLPGGCPVYGANGAEVAKLNEQPMSAAKPLQNHSQPAGHQPGGDKAIRIQPHHGAEEAPAPHLPRLKAQQQGADHRHHRVLEVRDQLDRKKGEGSPLLAAEKARNGDLLLLELGEQFNGIAPIRLDHPIAVQSAAQWTARSNESRKIDTAGKERFLVFPKALEFVNVGQLDFSVPRSQGGRLWASQTFGSASLLSLVILPRSIPYLTDPPTVTSSVRIPHKFPAPYTRYIAGDNIGHSKKGPVYRYMATREAMKQLELPGMEVQRSLPFPTMELKGQRYKVFGIVSNMDWEGEDLIPWLYKRCGKSEEAHSVMKEDLAGGRLPSGKFGENAAWWWMMVLAFNLNAAMKGLVLGGSWVTRRMKAIRYHLINLPGRVLERSRRLIIRLGKGHPSLRMLLDARARINELALEPSG